MAYRLSMDVDTTKALRSARELGKGIEQILNSIDPASLNSKTMTFVKNLTAAQYRMERLANKANELANAKIPTESYAYMSKELSTAEKSLSKMLEKKAELERSGNTRGNAYQGLLNNIEAVRTNIRGLKDEMRDMETANEAFVSGATTDAFKKNIQALNLQNQATAIIIEKFKEFAEANGIVLNLTKQNIDATNKETDATKNLQRAEEDLDNSRQKRMGIRRGVAIRNARLDRGGDFIGEGSVLGVANPHRRGVSAGPSLSGARLTNVTDNKFFNKGDTVGVRQLSQDEEHLDNTVKKTNEDIQEQNKVVQQSSRSYASASKAARGFASTLLSSLGNAMRRVIHGLGSISRHLHSSHKSSKGLGDSMKHTFLTFLRFTLGIRSIFMLVRRIRGYIKEAFKVMAQEIPEVNKDISRLGTSFKQLKAGFGTMLQPVLKMLTPILDTLLQKVLNLMNAIGKFFATLAGQDYVYEATVANYDYAESVKEAENSLASFDKLNVISKSKNDLSLNTDTVTYKKVKINPEDKWYTQLAKAIKEGWEKADLSDATNGIAKKLAKWLDGIKWEDIKARSKKFIKTLASGINGLTLPDPETGKSDLAVSIGKTIANAIDWAIENLYEWVNDIHWSNLGKFFADAIDALKTKLREEDTWKDAGMAMGRLFQGLVEFGLELFVKGNIFEGLGTDLATMLSEALEKGLEENPDTGNTYLKDFGIMITKAITKFLDEVIAFLNKTEQDGKLGKAVNELFKGIDVLEIAKKFVTAFLKGFKLGLELLIQAGLGALGLDLDTKTVETLAEAFGLGILTKKIYNVIKAITGSGSLFGGSSRGGLLGAFKKKDKALDTQKEKIGAESGALEGLMDKVGSVATALTLTLVPALTGTSDEIQDLTTKTETYTKTAETSNDTLKKSYDETVTTLKNDITAMETALNDAKLKTPNVDTTSLDEMLKKASGDTDTLKNLINTMDLSIPSIGTAALDAMLEKVRQTVADAQKEMDKILGKNTNNTVPGSAPYYELTQNNIKVTKELTKKQQEEEEEIRRLEEANNKTNGLVPQGYVEHSGAADDAKGKGAEYQKWLNEQSGLSVKGGTPLYELTQDAINSEQKRQKEEAERKEYNSNNVTFTIPTTNQVSLATGRDAIGMLYDTYHGSATDLSREVFIDMMQEKLNSLTDEEFASLAIMQMAAKSGADVNADEDEMVDYWKNLLNYGYSDTLKKYQGRDKFETLMNTAFGITSNSSTEEKAVALISKMSPYLRMIGGVSDLLSPGLEAEKEAAEAYKRMMNVYQMLRKAFGSGNFKMSHSGMASGGVIPPNKPFLTLMGEQTQGVNVEAPLSTIKQAVAEVMANMQIKNTFNVKGDPNGIFKVVLDETKIFYNQHGYSPFPSEA